MYESTKYNAYILFVENEFIYNIFLIYNYDYLFKSCLLKLIPKNIQLFQLHFIKLIIMIDWI